MRIEILRAKFLSKTFQGVKALNNVNLNVFKGEVLGLVGENGAGKSLLIKILAGLYSKDSGSIFFNEKKVDINSAYDAQKLGICIICQEHNLIPKLSVADNIFLGKEKRSKIFFVNKKKINQNAEKLMRKTDLNIDPNELISSLSDIQKLQVEISKALAANAALIIFDETATSLTEIEKDLFKKIIYKLKGEGISVIFVSHKLKEVLELADRITVLRNGFSVGTYDKSECNEDKLISLMAERESKVTTFEDVYNIGEEILRVEKISTPSLLKNISFTLHRGEILGLVGVLGSGCTELVKVIFGINSKSSGNINIRGKKVDIKEPLDAIRNKIALIPAVGDFQGLILNMSIKENITLAAPERVSSFRFFNSRIERFMSRYFMQKLGIKNINEDDVVKNLSGGNQRKVVISKWLSTMPDILMIDQPLSGIDIGAKREICDIIKGLAREGKGVILVSTDLDEIWAMSDRIIVMDDGMIRGELSKGEVSQKEVLSIMMK